MELEELHQGVLARSSDELEKTEAVQLSLPHNRARRKASKGMSNIVSNKVKFNFKSKLGKKAKKSFLGAWRLGVEVSLALQANSEISHKESQHQTRRSLAVATCSDLTRPIRGFQGVPELNDSDDITLVERENMVI